MFREIILPIFRSTRLCVTACGIMHTTSCNTHSSAPEDVQNNCPKHVELTGIINKPLLLHLVCCLYYLWCTVKQISDNEIYLLIKYIKSVLWRVAKRLSCIEDARCLKVNTPQIAKCSKRHSRSRITGIKPTFFSYLFSYITVARFLGLLGWHRSLPRRFKLRNCTKKLVLTTRQ
jgi:hypothetical protein